jgi:EAL domain-containing protein (putative c-di-GMP-specific phosphodiesterase class I)/GGDEF domain-containing protein
MIPLLPGIRELIDPMAQTQANPEYIDTLKKERDRFVALAFCAADMLFEIDGTQTITYAAGATKALTGSEPHDVIGRQFIDLIDSAEQNYVAGRLDTLGSANRLEPMMVRLKGPKGPTPRLMLTGYHLPDLPGSFFFALRLTSKDEALADKSDLRRDPETGLLNKDAFTEFAVQRIKDAEADGQDLKVTMVRLEEMSELRTRLDEESDRDLMRTLGRCFDQGAGNRDVAAKFDDENYGVLHDDSFDVDALRTRLENRLRDVDLNGVGIRVHSSTAPADLKGAEPQDAIKALLYTINQYCADPSSEPAIKSLSENLDTLTADASAKMVEFREMVSADSFNAVFQPIVDLPTKAIHHYEVLARFSGGLDRSPYELITFAENMGLICDFDFAMFRKVIGLLHGWRKKGKVMNLAVNLSGRSIENAAFVDALLKLLGKHDTLRKQISIEITESARIHDLVRVNGIIQSLRTAGHAVCLDDFGAGSAALKYLHALDVDIVKIDGAYIQQAHDDRKLRAFIKAIAGLCRELEIDTIAEMVEEEATVAFLIDCGIPYAQGYLYGKPSPDIFSFEPMQPAKKKPLSGGWSRKRSASV